MKKILLSGIVVMSFIFDALQAATQEITGVSEPFQFGSPPTPVPLSFLAIVVPGGLMLLYGISRHIRRNRTENL